jgi:hypothetical protein
MPVNVDPVPVPPFAIDTGSDGPPPELPPTGPLFPDDTCAWIVVEASKFCPVGEISTLTDPVEANEENAIVHAPGDGVT